VSSRLLACDCYFGAFNNCSGLIRHRPFDASAKLCLRCYGKEHPQTSHNATRIESLDRLMSRSFTQRECAKGPKLLAKSVHYCCRESNHRIFKCQAILISILWANARVMVAGLPFWGFLQRYFKRKRLGLRNEQKKMACNGLVCFRA